MPLLFALLHATDVLPIGVLQRLDSIIYDARLRWTMPRTLDERIVVVDIDEKSLAEVGHWPWARVRLAELMDELFERQQIGVVGFDVVFPEEDDTSGLQQLRRLASGDLKDEAGFVQKLQQLQGSLDYDALFAQSLQQRPVVLGYYFTSDRGGRTAGVLPPPVMDKGAMRGLPIKVTSWNGFGANIAPIAGATPLGEGIRPRGPAPGRPRARGGVAAVDRAPGGGAQRGGDRRHRGAEFRVVHGGRPGAAGCRRADLALVTSALNMSYGYFVESRSKRELANLFGTYVPPELVDEMVKDPDSYSMKAASRELTVMFCDMRNFTKVSEKLQPAQVQELLNTLFNRLTDVIRSNRGTIDKYMGDCVMAFWGAPVEIEQPAHCAVKCALEMANAVRKINEEQRAKGLAEIGVGIGLNTGMMFVGDMGSDIRRSYTVIGDAVNPGSRLEGLSKVYGVDIVASETTRRQAPDFAWQEIDRVRVKGKEQSVAIYWPAASTRRRRRNSRSGRRTSTHTARRTGTAASCRCPDCGG